MPAPKTKPLLSRAPTPGWVPTALPTPSTTSPMKTVSSPPLSKALVAEYPQPQQLLFWAETKTKNSQINSQILNKKTFFTKLSSYCTISNGSLFHLSNHFFTQDVYTNVKIKKKQPQFNLLKHHPLLFSIKNIKIPTCHRLYKAAVYHTGRGETYQYLRAARNDFVNFTSMVIDGNDDLMIYFIIFFSQPTSEIVFTYKYVFFL